MTGDRQLLAVAEADPLVYVVVAGGDQHRHQAGQQRALGDPSGAVRRSDRAERGDREHQRPAGGRSEEIVTQSAI